MHKCKESCKNEVCLLKFSEVANTIGNLDELIAYVGICWRIANDEKESYISIYLDEIQHELSAICSEVIGKAKIKIEQKHIKKLEHYIQKLEFLLEYPKGWYFGRDSILSAHLNYARTIVRRCERDTIRLTKNSLLQSNFISEYLNKLSSLFYAMSLFYSAARKDTNE